MQTNELERKLKRPRLGRLLETLDLRLSQAQQERIGYLEFLELLLEDEINRRANHALAQRVARARFEETKTLTDFDFGYNPKIPATTIRDLATCGYLERKESVIICGPVGVGKSHIAQALGHIACQRGYDVIYRKASKLLSDLGGGHADGTWEKRMRAYLLPDLLIIDDFGLRDLTPLQAQDFYELVCERYRRGSLMVVSNRTPKDWYALFPNPVLAEVALDRLINSSHHVFMLGRSYRPLRRPDQDHAKPDVGVAQSPGWPEGGDKRILN
ncbi:MAG TPA: ATP-binding protein [Firmicutes bacterium]|nr:ATP-binding protein [Bacillota bacterium]